MICLIALPILAILGIFSATHRKLSQEAFECVFRTVTFRKCRSNFDQRVKSKIVGKLMKRTPRTAGFVYKRFVLLSWVFVILFIGSTIFSAQGVYSYTVYGNCNGEQSDEFCIFDSLGNKISCGSEYCTVEDCNCGQDKTKCLEDAEFVSCQGGCQ